MTYTYTYTLLEVSAAAYDEIAEKLSAFGYIYALNSEGGLDMGGLTLVKARAAEVPAAAEINALPERMRRYVHDLESNADPAGDKWRLLALEENVAGLAAEIERLRAGLKFYADGVHFGLSDKSAWDTVSGEPQNWWRDEAGTATIEDGTIAKQVLAGDTMCWDAQGDLQLEPRTEQSSAPSPASSAVPPGDVRPAGVGADPPWGNNRG